MKNIHVLPTDKPSRIYLIKSNNKLGITSNNPEFTENFGSGTQNQNIYITINEEIKEGDWVLFENSNVVRKAVDSIFTSGVNNIRIHADKKVFKIILTTDQDLIKDGVQAIDDNFLKWFVKNPNCEKVKIDKCPITNDTRGYITFYKIIIPKEEPKQETLEETSERILANNIDGLKDALQYDNLFYFYKDVIKFYGQEMAKWQQERSYSEEEVKDIMAQTWIMCVGNDGNNFKELRDIILKQFKK